MAERSINTDKRPCTNEFSKLNISELNYSINENPLLQSMIMEIDKMCPICYIEFERGESVKVMPECKHTFHIECID